MDEAMNEEIVEIIEPVKGGDRVVRVRLKDVPEGYIQVEYNDKLYWMNPNHITIGNIKQEPFVGELKRKIIKLADQLQEVLPRTCEEWEENLRREPDPEKEIDLLFHVSTLYKSISVNYKDMSKKKELIKLLFECSLSTRNEMLKTFKPIHLDRQEASKAIKQFYE
jgi:hypothetical protein